MLEYKAFYYHWCPTKYIVGEQVLERLPQEFGSSENITVITGKYFKKNQSLATRVQRILEPFNVVYIDVELREPTEIDVLSLLRRMQLSVSDLSKTIVIVIGGGALIDLIKGTLFSLYTGIEPKRLAKLPEDELKSLTCEQIPLLCVPTVPGSGTDFNDATVITDANTGLKTHWITPQMSRHSKK
jgi:alcohol dehydrogenase class IV